MSGETICRPWGTPTGQNACERKAEKGKRCECEFCKSQRQQQQQKKEDS